MEANSTASIYSKRVVRPSTEKLSLGHRSERLVARLCKRRGYRILQRNLRLEMGEIDILAMDKSGCIVVVEVRSRSNYKFRPSRNLSLQKQKRLRTMAEILGYRFQKPVRVELWEVLGGSLPLQVNRFVVD